MIILKDTHRFLTTAASCLEPVTVREPALKCPRLSTGQSEGPTSFPALLRVEGGGEGRRGEGRGVTVYSQLAIGRSFGFTS